MAYRELTVIEVREILRRWRLGESQRAIARVVAADRKTVRRYIQAAVQAGMEADGDGVTDDELARVVARIQPGAPVRVGAMRQHCRAHAELIEGWAREGCKGPKLVRLLERHTGVPVPRRTMQRFVRQDLGLTDPAGTVRLLDFEPGEVLEVDFAELGWCVLDGERTKVHALLLVASYSRHMFVWPCTRMTRQDVIEGLEAAWAFFGGVFRVLVPDNLKAVVDRPDSLDPSINVDFLQYAQDRGFLLDPARVRRPQDKPRVERQVQYVRNDFFRGERFVDLASMRQRAARWCREVAGMRTHGTTRQQPLVVFEQDEAPALKPAPTRPYDVPVWHDVKVGRDHTVAVAEAIYSVPYRLRGQTLRVEVRRDTVSFYADRQLVKRHPRAKRGALQLDAQDLPPGTADLATKNADQLQRRAERAGPHVATYVHRLLEGPHPWSRFRHVYRLLGLCERYGPEAVDQACDRALGLDVVDVPRIDRMLQRGVLKRAPASAPPPTRGTVIDLRFARARDEFRTSTPGGTDAS